MMKKYKCHKEVTAKSMNRADYNVYRGWQLPEDEDGSDEGYLIEYCNRGMPNHPDHKGYISWSPKKAFDDGYSLVPEDFKGRLEVEIYELRDKMGKLELALGGASFRYIPDTQVKLMQVQIKAMDAYITCLESRYNSL